MAMHENNNNKLPTTREMNSLILGCNQPLLLQGYLDNWPLMKYTEEDWNALLGERPLTCRLGRQRHDWKHDEPQFEGKCKTVQCSYDEFLQWQDGRSQNLVLKEHSPADWFLYFDYKYMAELFDSEILDTVDWSGLGFLGRSGRESTLWFGTQGANTPCHYDTYGCNLVAQISGRKRWILFPPKDAEFLWPTRVPYEESSVYSEINFQQFDTTDIPLLGRATPYIVTLEPGDVLFLPRHWWHYVDNLETSVSINTWIELDQDSEVRVQEALVKVLMACASKSVSEEVANRLLNPNEQESTRSSSLDETLQYVTASLDALAVVPLSVRSTDENLARAMTVKYPDRIHLVSPAEAPQQHKKPKISRNTEEEPVLQRVLNAFCRPEVLQMVIATLRAESPVENSLPD